MLIKEYSNGCKAVLATEDHARELAPLLREYDSIEVSVGRFGTNEEALLYGVRNDDVTITGLDPDGKPMVMFGVGSSDDSIPYIWLLGSKGVRDYWYTFAKASKEMIPHLLLNHPCVTNIVLKDYDDSVRWLRWLGAKFIREVEVGGQVFYEFIIRQKEPTSVGMPVEDFRESITLFNKNLQSLPNAMVTRAEIDAVNPLEHFFGDGMYIRKIVMPAGQVIVSKIHKQDHPYFIMSGDVSVLTEEGVKRYKAPYFGMTKPDTQRVLFTHEETTWITVQRTNNTDLKEIEKELTEDSFDYKLSNTDFNLLTEGTK